MRDPWFEIAVPDVSSPHIVNARRARSGHPFRFFWARDGLGRCLFFLMHAREAQVPQLPLLRSIVVEDRRIEPGDNQLVLLLAEDEYRELFGRLCEDILDATDKCEDEVSAVGVTVGRTWRWHELLRSARRKGLTEEAQRGLVSELLFLRDRAIRWFGADEAVKSWIGPESKQQDFLFGRKAVEVKTRAGGDQPYVQISSEFQLEPPEGCALWLHVVRLATAAGREASAFTLAALADSVGSLLKSESASAAEEYAAKLRAVGFDSDDGYDDRAYVMLGADDYTVDRDFPRLQSSYLPNSVRNVSYRLYLAGLGSFRVEKEVLERTLREA